MDDYKIAIIYGKDDEKNHTKDGMIHYYGKVCDDYFHNVYLLNYTKEYYPDTPIFQSLNPRHPKEIIAYFLVKMGHIVFFNTTRYEEKNFKKYGKLGLLMLPDVLTEKQKAALIQFSQNIPDFQILISYRLKIENGLLDSNTYQSVHHETPEEMIRNYLEQKETNFKK